MNPSVDTIRRWKSTMTVIPISEVSRLHPDAPCRDTIYRWKDEGVKVGSRTVRLMCWSEGRRFYTTEELYHEFVAEQNRSE